MFKAEHRLGRDAGVDKLHLQMTCCKDGDMIEVALNSVHWQGRIGGVVVSVLATGPKGVPRGWIFKGDKNPQYTFLRMGSKAGGPMTHDFTACKISVD
jgi:hypothetical protein